MALHQPQPLTVQAGILRATHLELVRSSHWFLHCARRGGGAHGRRAGRGRGKQGRAQPVLRAAYQRVAAEALTLPGVLLTEAARRAEAHRHHRRACGCHAAAHVPSPCCLPHCLLWSRVNTLLRPPGASNPTCES